MVGEEGIGCLGKLILFEKGSRCRNELRVFVSGIGREKGEKFCCFVTFDVWEIRLNCFVRENQFWGILFR